MTGPCHACDRTRRLLPVEGKRLCEDCAWGVVDADARELRRPGGKEIVGSIKLGRSARGLPDFGSAFNGRPVALGDGDGGRYVMSALEAAVPLLIADLAALPAADRERLIGEWYAPDAQTLAERADIILYRDSLSTGTRQAFDALARTVAALAFAAGGVDFMGRMTARLLAALLAGFLVTIVGAAAPGLVLVAWAARTALP